MPMPMPPVLEASWNVTKSKSPMKPMDTIKTQSQSLELQENCLSNVIVVDTSNLIIYVYNSKLDFEVNVNY